MEIYPDNQCLDCNYRITCILPGKNTNRPGCLSSGGNGIFSTKIDEDIQFMVADAIENAEKSGMIKKCH